MKNELFSNWELLPKELTDILKTFDTDASAYFECERVLELIKPLGYTFDYDLSGEPYNLRKSNPDNKYRREIVLNQIQLQEEIQYAGYNIVNCGNCGEVLIHRRGENIIRCFCGEFMDACDCPDLYYSNMENNSEFI